MKRAEDRVSLTVAISDAMLGEPGQYREIVALDEPGGPEDRVALVRSCGRAAGRRHNLRVRTLHHLLDDDSHEVLVVNVTPIDPDDELAQARWERRLRAVVNGIGTTTNR